MEDFQYVVKKQERKKICFGSGCSRDMSKRGMTSFMRYYVKDNYENIAPGTYNAMNAFLAIKNKNNYFCCQYKSRILNYHRPGTYTPVRKKEIAFEHSFGGRVKMRLGVQFKCCSNNTDICKNCGQKPKGDYWHWKDKIFVCRLCMIDLLQKQSRYKREELNHFSRVRDCSDIHRHDGTDANIWLIHPELLRQRLIKETYLTFYLKN
ncbi:PREDICTED: uncharacterized protein LOC106791853 isoform X2 [Polistes canadensis]|uniref:uncharacterized protein LOC106791853 isoform X2 n=1 Tax=Polistes canadensis TaxID=91411 RepID=UPI000718C33D|nr:PREDICTED: uncharacterized protein LOC106791853 isoform X2 [Polistes canadensis]